MDAQTRHLQTLGMAILAVGSAAIGFGLLQNAALAPTYRELVSFPEWVGVFAWGKVFFGILAIAVYFGLILNVLLAWELGERISVREITRGALLVMAVEMFALTMLFISGAVGVAIG